MAKKKFKPLSNEQIITAVEQMITSCGNDSKLSKEREAIIKYYDGERPGENQKGRSRYISQDVWDSVEGLKAQLLEVFATGAGVGKFSPTGPEDTEACRIASLYTDYVIFSENKGEEVMEDVIHDGLTARVGWSKVYWEEKEEEVEEEFNDVNPLDLVGLLGDPSVDLKETPEEADGLLSGTILRKNRVAGVRLESCAPEEIIISPATKDASDFIAQKVRKTRSDLLKEGYTEAQLAEIPTGDDGWSLDPEALARAREVSDGTELEAIQDQSKTVAVYECYLDLDMDGNGRTALWQVIKAGKVLLHKQQVDRHPFLYFVPLRLPHRLVGSSYGKKIIPTQNAKTALTRGILDHTMITNNPRYQVLKGGVPNPDEVTENRFGGIVNVNRPDALIPLAQAGLNPFVFQTINLLDVDLEDTSGVSRLSQGIDRDVISKQNSRGLVQDMAALSMTRQKKIARAFGRYVRALYQRVYDLVVENEDRNKVIELAGNWVDVNPSSWQSGRDFQVDLCIGYGEKDKQAADLISLDQWFSQDPMAPHVYTAEKKYALRARVMELKGIRDPQTYLVPPQQQKPPQPDPFKVKEMELAERQVAIAERQQALAEQKMQAELQEKGLKLQLQKDKQDNDTEVKVATLALNVRKEEHAEYVAQEELRLTEKATDVRAIASPSAQ